MSKILQRFALIVIVLGCVPSPAVAQVEKEILPDGRLVGYPAGKNVIEQPSTATAWLLLLGLGLVAIGPLFLNAHRTHLD